MNDKFYHDAFTKVGFPQWKNAYVVFSKHNHATIAFHDF
jgi:hypothetical protein